MRLSNGFVIDKEKTFGELKFTAVRDVFLQNEDGTPSTQLKKRIYDLKCSLHGGIIPVSVPPEVPLREFPYNAVVELVNPVADTVSRNKRSCFCFCRFAWRWKVILQQSSGILCGAVWRSSSHFRPQSRAWQLERNTSRNRP